MKHFIRFISLYLIIYFLHSYLYSNVLVEAYETKNMILLYLVVAITGQIRNGSPRNRGDEQEELLSEGNDS